MAEGTVLTERHVDVRSVVSLRLAPREYALLRWLAYAHLADSPPERSSLQAAFVPVDEALGLVLDPEHNVYDAMAQVSP